MTVVDDDGLKRSSEVMSFLIDLNLKFQHVMNLSSYGSKYDTTEAN